MSKKAKIPKGQLCHPQTIFFTANGKRVQFVGRKAGAAACGGRRPPSAKQQKRRDEFEKAAKVCNQIAAEGKRGQCFRQRLGREQSSLPRSAPRREAPVRQAPAAARAIRSGKAVRVTDTSICDAFENPTRKALCLKNLRAGNVLLTR